MTVYEPYVCGKIQPASAVFYNLTNVRVFNRHGGTRFREVYNPSTKLAARLEKQQKRQQKQ